MPTAWGSPEPLVVGRPVGLTIAAIVLAVMGLILLILGALFVVAGAAIGTSDAPVEGLPGVTAQTLASVVGVIGVVFIVMGLLQLVAGIASYAGREWGRFLGIVLAILGLLLGILTLLGAMAPQTVAASQQISLATGLLFVFAYGFAVIALATSGGYFRARRGL